MNSRYPKAVAAFAALLFATTTLAGLGSDDDPKAGALQLAIGQQVKVEGGTQDGVFTARQVALRDVDLSAKVEGTVASVSSDKRRLTMLGFEVVVDEGTRLYRGTQLSKSRAMLAPGAWIEAKGSWNRRVLRATRIRVKGAPEATEEIEGVIERIDLATSTVVVLSRRIVLPNNVAIVDERRGDSIAMGAPADRLRRDDDDGQERQPIVLGNTVLGGRLEAGYLNEGHFDVDARDVDRTVLSRVQMLVSSQITDTIEAYAKLTMSRNVAIGAGDQSDARISEAFVLIHEIAGTPIDLQIGRQRFRDSREWFFDDYLDAARLHVTLPAVKLQAAVSRGILSGPQELRRRRDQLQFIGSATTRVAHVQVSAYALARQDTTRGERPVWIGGATKGRVGSRWSYWTDAAVRRGRAGATRLGGWAVDVGGSHRWARKWSPTFTVGYATASGDRTRSDDVDTRFRQTDLEDNRAYFGGLRRVAIYGEVFDPELSSLRVLTAGIGVRPRRGLSLDAIYHRFQQATSSRSLPSSNLDGALTGVSPALGHEVDLIVTVRAIPGVDLDLASGAFMPGDAFVRHGKPAFFWRPQLRFYF